MAGVATAAAGVAVVAAAASAASVRLEAGTCCGLRVRQRKAQRTLPPIDARAPLVRCYSEILPRSFTGKFRVALLKDILLFGRSPGPAEQAVQLGGSTVHVQGAVVVVAPRLSATVTLWLDDASVAHQWAEALNAAAEAGRPAAETGASSQPQQALGEQRAQNARISELEARVQATLHAAVERAQRIRELETAVEEGKEKDLRIRSLQNDLQETTQEVNVRDERIKELETMIKQGGTAIRDDQASAILQDAMAFAEQMLGERDEVVMDNGSAVKLREAVDSVVESNPAVNREVAELIHRLVGALRWPLALRGRMEEAEKTVQEQKEKLDAMTKELNDIHRRQVEDEKDRKHMEVEAEDLRERLRKAEQAAVASQEEQKALLDAAHQEELRVLKQWHTDAEQKRVAAEAKAKELEQSLRNVEQAADLKVQQQRDSLEAQHQEELKKVRRQHQVAEAMMGQVELRASELREQLRAAGVNMDQTGLENDARFQELLATPEREALPGAAKGELEYSPEHWIAAADEASQKLREVQQRLAQNDSVKELAPNKFEELEQRLAAAEKAVGQLAPQDAKEADGGSQGVPPPGVKRAVV